MTESLENTESLKTPESPKTPGDPAGRRHDHRQNRLYRALAWVGIAAGSLFIAGSVFFSGYVLGQNGNGGGEHHGPHRMMLKPFHGPDGPMGARPDGPMGPDGGPRSARLTPPSPSALPSTAAPAPRP